MFDDYQNTFLELESDITVHLAVRPSLSSQHEDTGKLGGAT